MSDRVPSTTCLRTYRLLIAWVLVACSWTAQAALRVEGRDINGNPVAASAPDAVFEYDPNLNYGSVARTGPANLDSRRST